MALADNALVSLADAKTYLGISGSDDDSRLEQLINASSTAIESFCDRAFREQSYRESYNGLGQHTLRLRHYPVTQITRVAYGSKLGFTVTSSVASDLRVTVEVQNDKVHLERYDSSGSQTQVSITFASKPTLSALVTQINTNTGFSATLSTDALSEDLFRTGAVNVKTSAAHIYFPDQDDTSYRLHEDRGTLEFINVSDYAFFRRGTDRGIRLPTSFAGVLVDYKAGYESLAAIPDDLAQACLLMTQYLFNLGKHDSAVQSETIGAYSYSLNQQVINEDTTLQRMLAPYVDRK